MAQRTLGLQEGCRRLAHRSADVGILQECGADWLPRVHTF